MDFELPDTRRVHFLTLAMNLSIITLIDISFPYNSLPSHNPVICCARNTKLLRNRPLIFLSSVL